MLLVGFAFLLIPIVGAGLAIGAWTSLRKRRMQTQASEEDRRRSLNEAKTVLFWGLVLSVPYPVIFLIVQLEKALFP